MLVEQLAVTPVEQPVAQPPRLVVDLAAEPVQVVDSVAAAAMQVAAAVTAVVDTANIGVSASFPRSLRNSSTKPVRFGERALCLRC